MTTRGRDREIRDRFVSSGEGPYTKLPLAILINGDSASASEIVAACLQDYGRAVVVGQRSFGKGTVQRLMRVESGRSLLKLTSATYWRPSEQNIHRMAGDTEADTWGVQPNPGLSVELDDEAVAMWRRFRSRRDLFGGATDELLLRLLDENDGSLPTNFRDQALDVAVEYLRSRLAELEQAIAL